jgi:hypothetical protein
VPTPN